MSARRRCVFCQETTESYVCFTENALLKAEWVSILSGGDATEMEKLRSRLTTRSFICRTHFPEESLTVTSSAVRVRPYAKPYPKVSDSPSGPFTQTYRDLLPRLSSLKPYLLLQLLLQLLLVEGEHCLSKIYLWRHFDSIRSNREGEKLVSYLSHDSHDTIGWVLRWYNGNEGGIYIQ